MTSYSVYEPVKGPADPAARAERLVFVKDGFSWPALFVPLIWLIYQRMWIELVLFIVVLGLLQWAIGGDSQAESLLTFATLAVSVLFAFEANDLRGFALERRGYRFTGVASGSNRAAAELAFFRGWLERQGSEAGRAVESKASKLPSRDIHALPRASEGEEVIGLFPQA